MQEIVMSVDIWKNIVESNYDCVRFLANDTNEKYLCIV